MGAREVDSRHNYLPHDLENICVMRNNQKSKDILIPMKLYLYFIAQKMAGCSVHDCFSAGSPEPVWRWTTRRRLPVVESRQYHGTRQNSLRRGIAEPETGEHDSIRMCSSHPPLDQTQVLIGVGSQRPSSL